MKGGREDLILRSSTDGWDPADEWCSQGEGGNSNGQAEPYKAATVWSLSLSRVGCAFTRIA